MASINVPWRNIVNSIFRTQNLTEKKMKPRDKFSSSNLISKFSQQTNIWNKILYTSTKENCYTKDILYRSHMKNA